MFGKKNKKTENMDEIKARLAEKKAAVYKNLEKLNSGNEQVKPAEPIKKTTEDKVQDDKPEEELDWVSRGITYGAKFLMGRTLFGRQCDEFSKVITPLYDRMDEIRESSEYSVEEKEALINDIKKELDELAHHPTMNYSEFSDKYPLNMCRETRYFVDGYIYLRAIDNKKFAGNGHHFAYKRFIYDQHNNLYSDRFMDYADACAPEDKEKVLELEEELVNSIKECRKAKLEEKEKGRYLDRETRFKYEDELNELKDKLLSYIPESMSDYGFYVSYDEERAWMCSEIGFVSPGGTKRDYVDHMS